MVANKKRFTLDLDPDFQRRLKVAAALNGISMRQYCVAAIEVALDQEQDVYLSSQGLTEDSLDRLSALRDQVFGDRMLPEDSADILRKERDLRTIELERRSSN